MNVDVKRIMRDVKNRLAVLYGARLKGVYLFGSYARNEADEESDLDVMIVLDVVGNYSKEINETSRLISLLSLEHGVTISRVFASENQWIEDQTLFFINGREEALPA